MKCKSLGATYGYTASLTSIHSEDENDAIWLWLLGYEPLLVRTLVWIGLIKKGNWNNYVTVAGVLEFSGTCTNPAIVQFVVCVCLNDSDSKLTG